MIGWEYWVMSSLQWEIWSLWEKEKQKNKKKQNSNFSSSFILISEPSSESNMYQYNIILNKVKNRLAKKNTANYLKI